MSAANNDRWLLIQELRRELQKRAPLSGREIDTRLQTAVQNGNLRIRYTSAEDEKTWEQVRGHYGYVDPRTRMDHDADGPRYNPFARFREGESARRDRPRQASPIENFLNDDNALLNISMVIKYIEQNHSLRFDPPVSEITDGGVAPAKAKRGPKPKYDWDALHDALMDRYFDNDGLIERASDDEKWAADWFMGSHGEVPSESLIREHVSKSRERFLAHNRRKKQSKKGR